MKSILGLCLTIGATLLFALAYYEAVRPGAAWLDGQWLFVVALPYNWLMLKLIGESSFSPDSPQQLIYALIVNAAIAYIAGALVEAALRLVWRTIRRPRRPA